MLFTPCSKTAFHLHRIPPQFRALLPDVPAPRNGARWRTVLKHPLFELLPDGPLHCLRKSHASCSNASNFKDRLWLRDLPFGALQDYGLGFEITSPAMTLFMLVREKSVSDARLIMAMYEMCGTFSLFTPPDDLWLCYQSALKSSEVHFEESWERVRRADGLPGNLWKREPLLGLGELADFAHEMKGFRCGKRFARCAALVTGICASPLEVQASMLFSLPAKFGGQGFRGLENNREIRLSTNAAVVAQGKKRCYADLYFEETATGRPLAIECQSRMTHDSEESFLSDSDRTAALNLMGIDVLPLTYKQLNEPSNYRAICSHLASLLNAQPSSPTYEEEKSERDLRYALFNEWDTI